MPADFSLMPRGFLVMEARRPGSEPIHYLLGPLPAAGAPLSELPVREVEGQPGLGVAADEDERLRRLLDEAAHQTLPGPEHRSGDWRWRVLAFPPGPMAVRLQDAAVSLRFRPWRLSGSERGEYAVVPLSQPDLQLLPIHRALSGLPYFEATRFLSLVREYVEIEPLEESLLSQPGLERARLRLAQREPDEHRVLLVLPQGEGKLLRFRHGLELDQLRAAPRSPTLRSLDLALLNGLVLQTVLGIEQPQREGHANVAWVDGLEALVEGVHSGRHQAGFGLNPPPVWELRAVMEAAQQLPPGTLRIAPEPPLDLLFPLAS